MGRRETSVLPGDGYGVRHLHLLLKPSGSDSDVLCAVSLRPTCNNNGPADPANSDELFEVPPAIRPAQAGFLSTGAHRPWSNCRRSLRTTEIPAPSTLS